jgi:hypothetical protein
VRDRGGRAVTGRKPQSAAPSAARLPQQHTPSNGVGTGHSSTTTGVPLCPHRCPKANHADTEGVGVLSSKANHAAAPVSSRGQDRDQVRALSREELRREFSLTLRGGGGGGGPGSATTT